MDFGTDELAMLLDLVERRKRQFSGRPMGIGGTRNGVAFVPNCPAEEKTLSDLSEKIKKLLIPDDMEGQANG